MSKVKIYLNEDLFEVDADQLAAVEQTAYINDPVTGELVKDWIKITEWIEMNGKLTNGCGYGKVIEQ